jgi:hypothetical protein
MPGAGKSFAGGDSRNKNSLTVYPRAIIGNFLTNAEAGI